MLWTIFKTDVVREIGIICILIIGNVVLKIWMFT